MTSTVLSASQEIFFLSDRSIMGILYFFSILVN